MPASLLIVDDHQLFRRMVRRLVQRELHLKVVEEARDGAEGLRMARERSPDIVLMDIAMPGMNGLEATRLLKAERPHTKVIILTIHDDGMYQEEAEASGADGFVAKGAMLAELVPAIRRVAADGGRPI